MGWFIYLANPKYVNIKFICLVLISFWQQYYWTFYDNIHSDFKTAVSKEKKLHRELADALHQDDSMQCLQIQAFSKGNQNAYCFT